jgi:hypothetical protein
MVLEVSSARSDILPCSIYMSAISYELGGDIEEATGNWFSQLTNDYYKKTKQTPWPLVRERTIPTEQPPLVDEI